MAQELLGKVAAITGAVSGIGLECVKTMLKAGARVVLADRNESRLRQICQELGPDAFPLIVDLSSPASVETMMPRVLEIAGHLDIFHANARSYVGGEVIDGNPDA